MNITVIGAGNSGLAMAAHLSMEGHKVSLWNRSEINISNLITHKTIKCSGAIEGNAIIHNVTTSISEAIKDTELILITTPANSHSNLAVMLSKALERDVPIILNPGRTFGAINFLQALKKNKCKVTPRIGEAQTIIYTCRKTSEDSVVILSFKNNVLLSEVEGNTEQLIKSLPCCLHNYFIPAKSMVETSLGNVGMILHCAPLLLNSGWTESTSNIYKYYYDGITPSVGKLIEKIDNERVKVSELLKYKVKTTKEWLQETYNVQGESIYECIQNNCIYKEIDAPLSLDHRYIYEDIPYGLVPLEKIGLSLGLEMKYTGLIINLAEALMEEDYRDIMSELNVAKFMETIK